MNQGDLFNGLALGHAAAERAADHAGEAWKDRAYRAFVAFAASRKTFTTEEARESCGHVGDPPDRRAWGAIALRAKRDGKVKAIGFATSKNPRVHGSVCTLWATI
jgi:hypothetical protein